MPNPKLSDEAGRTAALDRYAVLDTPPAEPFDKITSLVKNVLKAPICAVSLIDRDRQWFKSIVGLDVAETTRSVSFCTHTIKHEKPLVIANAEEDPCFKDNPLVVGPPYIRSYAGAPLRTPDGYNVGALCVIDTVPRSFTDAQLAILSSFAALVVDELELRLIAERDHLTGALTRRGFVGKVEAELEHARSKGRTSFLLLMDIDHFKAVNDSYGHPAGDKVLRAVAETCSGQLRANDLFGRLGGEEFGILLPDTDEAGARSLAEDIRCAIESHSVPVAGGIGVTASFGLAALTSSVEKAEDWISQADRALYGAKRSGRNRCVMADPQMQSAAT